MKDNASDGQRISVIADTHVHLYPCYDLGAACTTLADNLALLWDAWRARQHAVVATDSEIVKIACLTERHDCHFFRSMQDGSFDAGAAGIRIAPTTAHDAVVLSYPDGGDVIVFGGRQVITSEGVEVLSLCRDSDISDGMPLHDTIDRVMADGGVPSLPWALGKWWFARGRVIRDALSHYNAHDFVVCDPLLRPMPWHEPALMHRAREAGFAVVAGSDPLPMSGEERMLGNSGTVVAGAIDAGDVVGSFKRALTDPETATSSLKLHGGLLTLGSRMARNYLRKARGRG